MFARDLSVSVASAVLPMHLDAATGRARGLTASKRHKRAVFAGQRLANGAPPALRAGPARCALKNTLSLLNGRTPRY
jgi:hypothetical protein